MKFNIITNHFQFPIQSTDHRQEDMNSCMRWDFSEKGKQQEKHSEWKHFVLSVSYNFRNNCDSDNGASIDFRWNKNNFVSIEIRINNKKKNALELQSGKYRSNRLILISKIEIINQFVDVYVFCFSTEQQVQGKFW